MRSFRGNEEEKEMGENYSIRKKKAQKSIRVFLCEINPYVVWNQVGVI